jgi:hypothetical protein
MSRTLQFKRYPTSVIANTKGANGELIIDTNNYTITVHNANTFGGIRLATETSVSNVYSYANSAYNLASQEPVGSQAFVLAEATAISTQAAFNKANNASNGFTQNAQSNNYTLQLSDAGKYLYYTPSANVTLTIPTSSDVPYTNGTTIMVVSQNTAVSANITVTPESGVSLFVSSNTMSRSRNVTPYGVATLMMVKANTWFITGFGVN